jgi:hypothetical protein
VSSGGLVLCQSSRNSQAAQPKWRIATAARVRPIPLLDNWIKREADAERGGVADPTEAKCFAKACPAASRQR